VFHDIGHGSVKLNFGTGSATKVEISGAENLRNHGGVAQVGLELKMLGSNRATSNPKFLLITYPKP